MSDELFIKKDRLKNVYNLIGIYDYIEDRKK